MSNTVNILSYSILISLMHLNSCPLKDGLKYCILSHLLHRGFAYQSLSFLGSRLLIVILNIPHVL